MIEKPPLGIMPRKFWEEKRAWDIMEAINRYLQANTPIPSEWIEEYNELIEKINSR
jgi:hypothetical protein